MTERSSSYNPYASSSSRRASLASSQPQANSGPQRGPDLKGVPVRPGSPREAKHASAASSSSAAAAQRIPDATPLHERQAQALTGLGAGKRKAQEQVTPAEDPKKARAAGGGLASASFPTLDLLEKCHKELNGAKGAESMYAIHYAAEKVAQWLRGTDRGAAARERILSFSRACPLDSVDDCDAVLQVVNCSGSQDLMEAAGREVGLRLGGTAIDAVARGRLFEACLRGRTYGSWLGVRYFMAGVVSACLPDGFTKERADEWLGHFREATNRPNRVDGFDPGLTWFEIEEGKEALADMAAACDLTSHEIVAYLIREHGHLLMDAENHDFFRCVAYPVYRAFDVSYQAFEDYWPAVLLAWAENEPGWRSTCGCEYLLDERIPVARDWALNQIQTHPPVAQGMVELLLQLEQSEDRCMSDPQACQSLLARLVSDPGRASQLPGVLLAVLSSCDFDQDPTAWRDVLRSFVLAAAPHASEVQWVAIGMEDRWFVRDHGGEGFLPRVHGEYMLDGLEGLKASLEVRKWLGMSLQYSRDAIPRDRFTLDGLTETQAVRLMCRNLDHSSDRDAAYWLERAAGLRFAFDRRIDLMAHVLQSESHQPGAEDFAFARRQVVSQMMEQGAADEIAMEALKDTKDTKDTQSSQACVEAEETRALSRQLELSQSMLALHRAWQKGQGLEGLLRQRQPGVARVEPKRKALVAYQRFLQAEIGQLTYSRLPGKAFDSVLANFLRPTLAQVDRLLALQPAVDAAPRALDDEVTDVREPQVVKPRPSSSSSSSSS